ncbi:MAG: hypothetical protein ACLTC4_07550 [Hungatella hathewayi]
MANELGYVNVTVSGQSSFMIDEQLNISDCLACFQHDGPGACAIFGSLRAMYAIDKQELLVPRDLARHSRL